MLKILQKLQPHTNNIGVMGAETIQKTRESMKSHKSSINILSVLLIIAAFTFNSCVTCKDCTQIKSDVIGFSDNIQTSYKSSKSIRSTQKKSKKPFLLKGEENGTLTNKENMQYNELQNAIKSLVDGENTCLYYAVDNGLNRIKEVRKNYMGKSKKSKYFLITFTDGLDNISNQLGKVGGNEEQWQKKYNAKIRGGIKKCVGKPNTFDAWVVALYGDDLKKSNVSQEEVRDKLLPLSGNKYGVDTAKVIVKEDIDELKETFKDVFKNNSFEFEIPKGYLGKQVKMILKNDENDSIYFEGLFIKKGGKYYFNNISMSNGLTFSTYETVISKGSNMKHPRQN